MASRKVLVEEDEDGVDMADEDGRMGMVKKKSARLNFGLDRFSEQRKTFRRIHSSKGEIITAEEEWRIFVCELWTIVRRRIKSEFPDPGIGGPYAINVDQFCDITTMTWGEIRLLIDCGAVTERNTSTGAHRDRNYIDLSKYPQMARYIERLFKDGQLRDPMWEKIFTKTNDRRQPFKSIPLNEVIKNGIAKGE
jgi:hypothetical protein